MLRRKYNEKRGFVRMALDDCPIHYEMRGGERGEALVRDLSGTGLQLICQRPFAVGSLLVLVRPLAHSGQPPPIEAEVEVVRVLPVADGYAVGAVIRCFLAHPGAVQPLLEARGD